MGNKLGYGACRLLDELEVEFYDFRSKTLPSVDDVRKAPVLFTVWTSNLPLKTGAWTKIGHISITDYAPQIFCKQDPVTGALSLTQDGRETPATLADCEGRETAAIWNSAQIEGRLNDHFAGRPNPRVEALKPAPRGTP
ncbi:MAG: hypothetical protein RL328_1791 [Acidobacteriota bacterium]